MSKISIKKTTKVQTFNITHTECYENKFCQFIENVYFCNRKPIVWFTERKRILLDSAIGELGHFTQYKVRKGNEFSLGLYSYSYDIHQVEKFRQPYPLYTTGSPSPTNRDRVRWMAPLSS